VSAVDGETRERLEAKVSAPPGPPAPSAAPPEPGRASSIDLKHFEIVRCAIQCRETLNRISLDSELWETLLLAAMEPQLTRAALEALTRDLEGDLVTQARADQEALVRVYEGVGEVRLMYADWVRSVRTHMTETGLAPRDPRAFEVGLGLMLSTPGAQDRLGSWLEDPVTWQEEALGLLSPWIRRAQDCLAAL
jgi:hypothetical protein